MIPLVCKMHVMGFIEDSKTANLFKFIVMNREERLEYERIVSRDMHAATREVGRLIVEAIKNGTATATRLDADVFHYLRSSHGSSILHEVKILNDLSFDHRPPILCILLDMLHSKKRWNTIEKDLDWRVSCYGRSRLLALLYVYRYITQTRRSRSLTMARLILHPGRVG